MYKLCKKNGYIWITQSVYGGNGFYNFDKSFFEHFAASNNLAIVYSAFLVNLPDYKQFLIPANKDLLDTLNLNKINNLDITYIFKKKTNNNFNYGYQYNVDTKDHYNIMYFNTYYPPEKIYIKNKSLLNLKKLARKGDKESIQWCRDLNIKY